MKFNLSNMIKTIRSVNGVHFTNESYFDCVFGTLILKMNIKKGGEFLKLDSSRISEVMNNKANLYSSVASLSFKAETKNVLLNEIGRIKKDLFGDCKLTIINKSLINLMESDPDFDLDLKKEILYSNLNDDAIFVEFVIYSMRVEYSEREAKKKYKIATGNFVTKKANATICSELIEQMIWNSNYKKENTKHNNAWTIDDKMNINDFDPLLKDRISDAFDEYDVVMTAIDNLSFIQIQAGKTLYAVYKNIYYRVLNDLLGNNQSIENIKKNSSKIFLTVNDYTYNLFLKDKIQIEEDIVRYNLFCITTAVFYQCKFLLKVEIEQQ